RRARQRLSVRPFTDTLSLALAAAHHIYEDSPQPLIEKILAGQITDAEARKRGRRGEQLVAFLLALLSRTVPQRWRQLCILLAWAAMADESDDPAAQLKLLDRYARTFVPV